MSKQSIFLVGATGETGTTILNALLEDGSFEITCLIRTSSAGKPSVQALKDRGLKVVTGDLTGPIEDIVALLEGIDIVIAALFPGSLNDQIPLLKAAAQVGVERFLPCNWGTPAARGGILTLTDTKGEVHDYMMRLKVPYTIVDVGYWYGMSVPRVPSGKFDYAIFVPANNIIAGGTAKNMLMDQTDVGRFTVKAIKDSRTLNKRVYAYGDLLSQNEINEIIERKTGENLELNFLSAEDVSKEKEEAIKGMEAHPREISKMYSVVNWQYADTKYVRADNTPENAEYLGYINGRDLYPDFKWIRFEEFIDDMIAGKGRKIYPHLQLSI
ncbi:NAD(P)-binding protein [Lojkania enalia]|uniref:NAD(P)-binding protein n=1 Tax=Lojkania enalia TaxID=147567 RepID=A0A9P4N4P3_9PLEO|nr:NAD(P)-binding protein [Didymosphaeria enalia]